MKRPVRKTVSTESLRLIGIPKSFRDSVLDDFSTKGNKDLNVVKSFIEDYTDRIDIMFDSSSGIIFSGSNGVGKTMLSCIILKEAYRHRYTSRRTTFVEYIDKYTKSWGAKSADEKEQYEDILYTYYKSPEFLVIDEVGKEIDSKVATPIFEDLLRYREDNGLVTIICTNLNFDTLNEKYGASCMSLIKGNCTPIVIESKDKRNFVFRKRVK